MADLSKSSYILVPITNETAEKNLNSSFYGDDGFWCAPVNGAAIGDEIWFYRSKSDVLSKSNAMIKRGAVIRIHPVGTVEQISMSSTWDGDWKSRDVIVIKQLPVLEKDKLSYDDICDLFGYDRMRNGAIRVDHSRFK